MRRSQAGKKTVVPEKKRTRAKAVSLHPLECDDADALKEAGWTLKRLGDAMFIGGRPRVGLSIEVYSDKNIRAGVLQKALGQIGFPTEGFVVPVPKARKPPPRPVGAPPAAPAPVVDLDTVTLFVGHK